MSHNENGSVIMMSDNTKTTTITTTATTKANQRLCHIVKRPDFDGYGFNLHSEKGKPGQYIGKVDEKSPAEQAGLRQGDRIIEVNGVNIGNDSHKQVVQRIKAIANEVRLLVIDPECEKKQQQNIKKLNNDTTIMTSTMTIPPPALPTTATTITSVTDITVAASTEKDNNKNLNQSSPNLGDNHNKAGSISPTTSTKSQTNSVNSVSNRTDASTPTLSSSTIMVCAANGHTTIVGNTNDATDSNNTSSSSTTSNNNGNPSKPKPNDSSFNNNQQQQQHQQNANGNSHHTSSTANSGSIGKSSGMGHTGKGLNLPMTAAEMRAKLMAKKKYDPKNDSVDLRKKFEIIQKL